jgi:Fic family protein
MATVKSVRRGNAVYHYLVQTYRWEGKIRKKQVYLGTSIPKSLDKSRDLLEKEIWNETWFQQFDKIRDSYQKRLTTIPRSIVSKERDDFVLQFTYDTNRIEGSSLTLEDTRDLLTRGITPPSKPVHDVLEAQRHAELVRRLALRPEPVDLQHLLGWHKELFGETKPDIAGRIRDFEVRIANSRHLPPPPLEVRPRLIDLVRTTNRNKAVMHPVQKAASFHLGFESIHPFGDGNGRIGRLAMNVLLAQDGFPMLNISYGRRRGYYTSLEESDLRGTGRPFLRWFFLRYSRDNRFYLREK